MTEPIDAALDYVDAAFTGLPAYTETVLAAHGTRTVARGLGALLVLVTTDAAVKAECEPAEIIQRMRETYGGIKE